MSLDSTYHAFVDYAVASLSTLKVIAIITVAGLVVERLLPAERDQPWARLRFNLLCVPLLLFVSGLVVMYVTPLIAPYAAPMHTGWLRVAFADGFWGSLAAVAVYMLIYDFFYYWWHRAQHESKWLWSQHKLHHSDRAINVSSTLRHHWLEAPFRVFLTTLPMVFLFDLKTPNVAWLVALVGYWPFFIHANLRLGLGPLSGVIAGPQYHRIHHSLEPQHHNMNYAAYLPVWDIVFRTAYLPKRDEFPATGLHDDEDKHLGKALVQPFTDWYRRLRDILTKTEQQNTVDTAHTRQRVFGLDLMRSLALLSVMFAHGLMLVLPIYPALIGTFTVVSVVGIELFFVLSGFLAGQLLIGVVESETTFAGFWIRRGLRTLPNYYLFLALSFCLYSYVFGVAPASADALWYGQSLLSPASSGFFPEAWRLTVEQWFYILIPIVLLVLLRVTRKGAATMLWICVVMLVAFPIVRMLYIDAYHPVWDAGLRKITLLRLDAPMWGVLFAWLKIRRADMFNQRAALFSLGALALLIPAAVYLCSMTQNDSSNLAITDGSSNVLAAIFFSLLPAGLAFCLPMFQRLPAKTNSAFSCIITWISERSYSLYLIHVPLLYVLIFFGADYLKSRPALIAIAALAWLTTTSLLGALNYHYFEMPMRNLRERWTVSRSPA